MSSLYEEFQNMSKNRRTDSGMLVPLMVWASGKEANIEEIQKINKCFFFTDKNILNNKLWLNNKLTHMIKYPKVEKDEEIAVKYMKDVARYYKWTVNELYKNLPVINLNELKETISTAFGYDTKETKALKKVTF